MSGRRVPVTVAADHEIPWFPDPRRWDNVGAFLTDFRADLVERYKSPAENTVITIAFAGMEDVENALRWFRYKRHPWQPANPERAFALYTNSGIPELWVHRDEEAYVRIYLDFLENALGIASPAAQLRGLQIDHTFARARAIRKDVGKYLLLSPIPQRSNSSHGYGEYVRSLDDSIPKPVCNADFVTFSKLMGWFAPKLSSKAIGGVLEIIVKLEEIGAIGEDDEDFRILVEDRLLRLREANAVLQAARRAKRKSK